MSRQAILSMPLSFAIVLVAAMALSGTARQAEPALPADPADDPHLVAEPSPVAPPEPLVAPNEDPVEQPEAPAPAPEPIKPTEAPPPETMTEPAADRLPETEHHHDEEAADSPNATSRPGTSLTAPEPPPLLDAPDATPDPTRSHGREHWRPIGPRPSPPSP